MQDRRWSSNGAITSAKAETVRDWELCSPWRQGAHDADHVGARVYVGVGLEGDIEGVSAQQSLSDVFVRTQKPGGNKWSMPHLLSPIVRCRPMAARDLAFSFWEIHAGP